MLHTKEPGARAESTETIVATGWGLYVRRIVVQSVWTFFAPLRFTWEQFRQTDHKAPEPKG